MPLLSPVSDTGDQQQLHQERNIRRPENSSEEVLEHSPASLPSIPLSPRPVSNRRPIIIQQSPPINQQSSAALVPPASASVVISHHKESPYRDLSRNIADQGEDASNVDSLPQTALEEDTQEANKTSTEKSSRRQSISSSLQGPKAPAEANLPSKRGVVVTQASTKPREKGPSTRENEERGDSSISQKHQYKRRESTAEKDHGKATEDYRRAKRASSDLDKGIPPAQEGVPTNIDLRSDSGYSSYTAAPVSSTMSAEYVPPQHRQYQVTEVPPRARSPRSNITTYRRSDPRSISPKPQVVRPVNNEIRLRVDANAPLSLQFIGNMEGRTMQLIPAEDGMADLIISGGDSDALGTVGNSNDQQERTQQNRRSKVGSYPRPPAAFESSSEYESEEDETYESHDEYGTEMFGGGEMGIRSSKGKSDSVYGIGTTTRTNRLSRRPSVSRLTPRREIQTEYPTSRSSFYENEPVEAVPLPHPRKPGYFQGAAVIQPAITRPRRPTVGRLTGYLTRTGPQNHWSRESSYYRSQRHGPPSSSSTAFSRSSQGSYYVESASNRERARGRELQQPSYKVGSRRVDTKRSDISPYPTRVTGKLNSPTIRPAPMPPINLRHPGLSEITSRPKSISRKALASSKPPTIIQQSEHPWKSTQKSRRVNRGRRSNMQSLEAQKTEKAPLRSERDETLTQERDEKSEILKSQKEEKYGYWDPRAGDSSISTRQRPEVITSQNQPGEPGYWHSFDDSDSGLSTPSICSSEGENTAIFGLSAPSANEARKLSGESSPSQIRQDVPIAAVKVRPALEYVVETPRGFAFENMKSPSDTQSLLPKDPNPGLKAYEGDSEPPSPTSQHPQPTSDLENSQQARVAPNTPASIEALGNIMTRSDKEIVLPSTTATPFTDNSIPSLITVKGGEYASEIISVPPSHAAMVSPISVESLPTLTSGISKSDGYSAVEIAAATKVLLSVLYEDDCLMHLCEIAIENQNIGRERLQKKLRRSLRACAARLYDNAKITTKRVEYLAAQLIHAKSAFLAQYIAKMLQDKRENAQLLHYERGNQSSEEEDDKRSVQHSIEKVFSNETFRKFMENNRIDLDPWVEEDLCTLREIVASSAFGHVSNQVAELVVPYLPRMESTEPVVEDTSDCDATGTQNGILVLSELFRPTLTWYEWFRHDTMLHARNQFLVAMGLLEPALDQNKVRLRWPCRCGDPIYSDVIEISEGGITELVDRMQRSSGVKVHATPYNRQSSNQQYIVPRPDRWLRNALTKVGMTFGGSSKSPPLCLPQHNSSYATTSCSTSTSSSPTKKILHLSMCMHRTRRRKIVKQDRVDEITTDRTLLRFLQRQYATHRGRFLNIARLKTVQRIVFVKFRLPMGGSVDVQHHLYCIADPANWKYCECTPPPNKVGVEYEYSPSPPKTHPPIPPEYLASLFTCATDVHEEDDWILNQLPKRTCGVLQGQKGQPAEGWGIYFLEGWDREIISLLILFIFFLASLLFGVLWWKFQFDLQGGFGVSAYMMAVCTIVVSVVVTRLENKG